MQGYAVAALGGPRWQALATTMRFIGVDLTGADFRLQVRLLPNTPGSPLVDLTKVSTAAAEGVRLISVETVDGQPVSTIGIRVNETTMEGLPFSGELGDSSVLAWDMQVTPVGGLKSKWIGGDFIVEGGVTGADAAPQLASAYGMSNPARTAPAGGSTFQIGPTVISVQMLGPGLIIQTEGDVAPGTVGADQLVNEATGQEAILAKLAIDDRDVAGRLVDADPARRLATTSPAKGRAMNFAKVGFVGQTDVIGVSRIGAAATTIDAAGRLVVDAAYNDASKRAFMPGMVFHEGRFRVLVIRGGNMIRFVDRTFAGRAIWENGGALNFGWLDGAGGVTQFAQGAMAGADGDAVWIELLTGPMQVGINYSLRCWKDGDPYPTIAAITDTYKGSGMASIVGKRSNEGSVMISSFAGGTAKIAAMVIDDGANGEAEILGQTTLIGRWDARFEGGAVVMASIRTGSGWQSRVTGTTGVSLVYVGAGEALPDVAKPVIQAFVKDAAGIWVKRGAPLQLMAAPGQAVAVTYPNDLDPSRVTDVQYRIRGTPIGADKFGKGTGVLLLRMKTTTQGGIISPLAAPEPRILFIGDSIFFEGDVARDTPPSLPSKMAGDENAAWLSSLMLSRLPIISAFGGTGLLVGNDSNQPPADDGITYAGELLPYGHAWNGMYGRPIDTLSENPEAIFEGLGTNDKSRGIAGNVFQPAFTAFLRKLLLAYPRARKIFVVRPLNGAFAAEKQAAITAIGDDRLYYVDTTTLAANITYTDGVHPTVASQPAMATFLANVYRAILL